MGYFVSVVTGQVAKNMTKAFLFDLRRINAGGSRPDGCADPAQVGALP